MHYIIVAVFAAFIVLPFVTWKPNVSVADSTPAICAPVEYPWLNDCSPTVQWAELFMPHRDNGPVVTLEALRLDKRDHGTGAESRPS
jgi:hypothetical protein